jgi:hypothetical protein
LYLLGIAVVLRSEGGAIVWPKLRAFFDEDFSRALEALVAEEGPAYLDLLLGDLPLSREDRTARR